jgi:DNA-binding MarR family transcriptional regulator
MSNDGLDPVIHGPARLRIMVTLVTLPEGDDLSFTRLQDLLGLTPGNLITHLRKLEDAGYVATVKSGAGVTARTSVSLTHDGRVALDRYTSALRQLLDAAASPPPAPSLPGRRAAAIRCRAASYRTAILPVHGLPCRPVFSAGGTTRHCVASRTSISLPPRWNS